MRIIFLLKYYITYHIIYLSPQKLYISFLYNLFFHTQFIYSLYQILKYFIPILTYLLFTFVWRRRSCDLGLRPTINDIKCMIEVINHHWWLILGIITLILMTWCLQSQWSVLNGHVKICLFISLVGDQVSFLSFRLYTHVHGR